MHYDVIFLVPSGRKFYTTELCPPSFGEKVLLPGDQTRYIVENVAREYTKGCGDIKNIYVTVTLVPHLASGLSA